MTLQGIPKEIRSSEQPRADPIFVVSIDQELIELIHGVPEFLRVRTGRKPSRAAMFRYASRGLKGVVLPTLRIGRSRYTSDEGMRWWIDRLSHNGIKPVDRHRRTQIHLAANQLQKLLGKYH